MGSIVHISHEKRDTICGKVPLNEKLVRPERAGEATCYSCIKKYYKEG